MTTQTQTDTRRPMDRTYRMPAVTLDQLAALAAARHGDNRSHALREAIARYWADVGGGQAAPRLGGEP